MIKNLYSKHYMKIVVHRCKNQFFIDRKKRLSFHEYDLFKSEVQMSGFQSCSLQTSRFLASGEMLPPTQTIKYKSALAIFWNYNQRVLQAEQPVAHKMKAEWVKGLCLADVNQTNALTILACELLSVCNEQVISCLENYLVDAQEKVFLRLLSNHFELDQNDKLEAFIQEIKANPLSIVAKISPELDCSEWCKQDISAIKIQHWLEVSLQELLMRYSEKPHCLKETLKSNSSETPQLKQVSQLSQLYLLTIETKSQHIESAQMTFENITKLVCEIKSQSQPSSQETQFLNNYLFEKCSVACVHPLTASAKKSSSSTTQLTLSEGRQNLAHDMNTIINTGKQINMIAHNLHIELPKGLSNTIQAVTGAATIFASALTYNIPGMLIGFSSLVGLGRGKKKGGGKKLKKMLAHFARVQSQIVANQKMLAASINQLGQNQVRIIKNQEAIANYLKQMDEKINQVVENQHKIHEDLITVSKQVELSYYNTANAITYISKQIYDARISATQEFSDTLQACVAVYEQLVNFPKYNSSINTCDTYQGQKDFYYKIAKHLLSSNLNTALNTLLISNKSQSAFWGVGKRATAIKDHFHALWGYIPIAKRSKAFTSLMLPTSKASDLELKMQALENSNFKGLFTPLASTLLESCLDLENDRSLMYHPYDPLRVSELVETACGLHYFYELSEHPGDQMYSLEELKKLAENHNLSQSGKLMLRGAIQHLHVAIAHMALLSGDCVLPYLEKALSSEQEREKVLKLLSSNPLLAQNFITYMLTKQIPREKIYDYQYAVSVPRSPHALEKIINLPGQLIFDQNKGWFVKFDELEVGLPKAATLINDGQFTYDPSLQKLLNLRRRAASEYAGYDVVSNLTEPQKQTYFWALSQTNKWED